MARGEAVSKMGSMLGIGAMIHLLGGGSEQDPGKYVGRKITSAAIEDDRLRLSLEDGTKISIWDDGQSCCESRYMRTDDDIQSLVGHTLQRIEARGGPRDDGEFDVHETAFVEIGTEAGFITIVNHNEHNGYYGGFGLTVTEDK